MAATQQGPMRGTASPLDRHAPPVAASKPSGRATASLVLGIIAVIGFIIPIAGIILGVIAIVLGATTRSQAKRAGTTAAWQATAGFWLGWVAIAASIANIAATVAMST